MTQDEKTANLFPTHINGLEKKIKFNDFKGRENRNFHSPSTNSSAFSITSMTPEGKTETSPKPSVATKDPRFKTKNII